MSDPTDRELAERNCPSDSHRPDKPGSYCECERILAALTEQREQIKNERSLRVALIDWIERHCDEEIPDHLASGVSPKCPRCYSRHQGNC